MSIAKVALFSAALLTYAALRISSIRKERRRLASEFQVPLVCQARKQIAFGILLAAITILLPLGITGWLAACAGGAGGSLLGFRDGRIGASIFQTDLERRGAIAPLVHSLAWILNAVLVFAGMAAVAFAAAHSPAFWIHRGAIMGIAAAAFVWQGGFFCAHGVYMWIWAKRKNCEGYGPLTITCRTEWPHHKA